ncbi:MAG: 50S ribosomal protein L11 methyltransferase [Lachnospiraceae bacterium]|nr:50S ribosomal protein L11 methyltransferase [Lachnospiraceae bacterium]MDD5853043.1 50S ribosomal protein L11 methyltransferase [Lachnospiraceae bacterium]
MKWKKLTVKTVTDAEDIIISELYDLGLEGAMIEDHVPLTAWEKEQMFVDILPDGPEDDGIAYLSFFVEVPSDDEEKGIATQNGLSDDMDNSYFIVSNGQAPDMDALVEAVRNKLSEIREYMDIGEGSITISETEDKDWLNNWKEFFHQFYIDDLLVTPSWEEIKPEDQDKKILHIDPGTAFGTGMHETTQLCIRQLKKYITPETVLLDVGTGSGILAIVSLMYGIKEAVGTDLDPCAVEAVRENMEVNGVNADQFEMMIGNIISDPEIQDRVGYEKYDIVVANILAEVLLPLTPVVKKCLKPGGIYITSGIIAEKEQLVVDAVKAAGMEVLEVTRQNEWVSVTARR